MQYEIELSVVIPLLNEEESILPLFEWLKNALNKHSISFEVIFIDDGSTDLSWRKIESLCKVNTNIKGIRFTKNYGKSQALHAGFETAQGEYVATLDADLQDSPEEIIPMLSTLKEKSLDLISGWKKKRYDSILFKNLPSKLFNWAARRASGIRLHDFNCGIKVYRKDVIKSIDVYGDMHRYIPVLAATMDFNALESK